MKEIVEDEKRRKCGEIFSNHVFIKGLASRTYKKHKLNDKKKAIQIENSLF